MKIVIVIDIYDLQTNGTVMTAYRFVNELKKRGNEVAVVATGANGDDCYNLPERYLPIVTEVARLQQIRFAKPVTTTLVKAFSGADIIHFYLPFKLEKEGKKLADKMGIPSTAAFHLQPENVTYNAGPLRYMKFINHYIYSLFRRKFYKKFDHIHCPSAFIASQLKAHHYKAKLHVISNGVDEAFKPLEEPKKPDMKHFNILMIGRYATEKRQDLIIKAISESKYKDQIYLTLAGKGPKKNKLVKLSEKCLTNEVTFGFYNEKELIEVIHNSDLYIHSADVEIEAIACIEAFSCGVVPIISDSKKSATSQFALDERSKFKAGDYHDLAKKIDYWIEHEKEKEEQSLAYIEESKQYTLEASVIKAEEMFKEEIKDFQERKKKKELKKSNHFFISNPFGRALSNIIYFFIAIPILGLLLNMSYGLKIRGRKNLKKLKNTGFITISNHVHILDCVMVALALNHKKITFTSLSSNFDIPVAGHLVKALGVIPTPGDIYQTELFLNNCKRILSTNKILHIYPEGHLIPYYNGLRDFNKGAFKIANKNEAPLLPVVISWRKRKGLFRLWLREKPCININICEPVFPDYSLPKQNQEKYLKDECFKKMLEQYNIASSYKVVKNNTLERMSKLEAEKMLLDLLDSTNEKIIGKLNPKLLAKANKATLKKDKILLLINQINELKDEA